VAIKIEECVAIKLFKEVGLTVIGEYKNTATNTLCLTNDGYKVYHTINKIRSNRGYRIFDISNDYTLYNINLFIEKHEIDIQLLSNKYDGCHKPLKFKCKTSSEEFEYPWDKLKQFKQCPICNDLLRLSDSNRLSVQRPDLIKYFLNAKDAELVSVKSSKEFDFKCDLCGNIKNMKVSTLSTNGFSCGVCSDGISIPEKFTREILKQININFETQKIFDWAKDKRYDFYIPSSNMIIETHGKQHYKETSDLFSNSLQKEQENDLYKYNLAIQNGINPENYVIIDCRYSDFDWLKENCIKSLGNYFDLYYLDFKHIWGKSQNSIAIEAIKMWNTGKYKKSEIASILKMSYNSIGNYLKSGASVGICDYDPKEESIKSGYINEKQVVKLSLNLEYIDTFKSAKIAGESIGAHPSNIGNVCKGKQKHCKGFYWMYLSDYEKLQQLQQLQKQST